MAGFRGELQDDCGFERKTILNLASKKSDVTKLRKEYGTRKGLAFHVEYLEAEDIKSRASFTASGALLSYGNAQVLMEPTTTRLVILARMEWTDATSARAGFTKNSDMCLLRCTKP